MTLASDMAPSPTCASYTSTTSRSISSLCGICCATRRTGWSCRRSSASRASSTSRRSPKASRTRRRWMSFAGWESTTHRASGSAARCPFPSSGMSTASDKEPHMPRNHDSPARPRELAKEQSLSELEQAIGDREQLVGDRDQSRIDQEQLSHDDERGDTTSGAIGEDRILDQLQARIGRQQRNRDISQRGLDHAQVGCDKQQRALDETRQRLNLPTSEQPQPANASAIHREAIRRARAARERADTALIRAQAAMVRAEDAAIRARDCDPSEN